MTEEELLRQYKTRGIIRGRELYLNLPDATNFISDCQANNLAVVGIEGFRESEGTITPDLNIIADYTDASPSDWDAFRNTCNSAAEQLIRSITTNGSLLINFVILSQTEWQRGR